MAMECWQQYGDTKDWSYHRENRMSKRCRQEMRGENSTLKITLYNDGTRSATGDMRVF